MPLICAIFNFNVCNLIKEKDGKFVVHFLISVNLVIKVPYWGMLRG